MTTSIRPFDHWSTIQCDFTTSRSCLCKYTGDTPITHICWWDMGGFLVQIWPLFYLCFCNVICNIRLYWTIIIWTRNTVVVQYNIILKTILRKVVKTLCKLWTHKRHPIAHPKGQTLGMFSEPSGDKIAQNENVLYILQINNSIMKSDASGTDICFIYHSAACMNGLNHYLLRPAQKYLWLDNDIKIRAYFSDTFSHISH